jgi:mannose-6-phosphate isomerase
MKLYPLQFDAILKERIWGGTKLKTYLNKPITSQITGESWEISTVENDISIVSNGILKGKSLNFRKKSVLSIWKTISITV